MKDPCSSVAPLLDKYFDGEASAEEKETIERHLTDCGACQGVLESMGRLSALIRTPVEASVEQEAFPWVWQKIQREIQVQPRTTWWESLRARLGPFLFPRRRAWVPAAVAVLILLSVSASFLFKKQTPSHQDLSVVEYVESSSCNVMVYESDQEQVTVIWLFECPEKEASPS